MTSGRGCEVADIAIVAKQDIDWLGGLSRVPDLDRLVLPAAHDEALRMLRGRRETRHAVDEALVAFKGRRNRPSGPLSGIEGPEANRSVTRRRDDALLVQHRHRLDLSRTRRGQLNFSCHPFLSTTCFFR